MSMPFLRLARAGHAGQGRVRPSGDRPRPQLRDAAVRRAASCSMAPNPSSALHKISEIYDRIAFAAVGRYNEYETLRKAGITYADLTGYQFDRNDVTARGHRQLVRPESRHHLHREPQAVRGRDRRRRSRRAARE